MKTTKEQISKEFATRLCAAKGTPITEPGEYETTVTSCNDHASVRNGMQQVAIANFNLTTQYFSEKAKTLFAQGDYREASNCNLTMGILAGGFRPSAGETVKVRVVLVTVKANGDTPAFDALFVRKIMPVPAKKVVPVSAADWLASVEGVEESFPEMINEETPAVFETEVEI